MIWPGAADNLGRSDNVRYIFGVEHDQIELSTLAWGDTAEDNRAEVANGAIITFDPNWPSQTIKQFVFRNQPKVKVLRFLEWFARNVGMPTRFLRKNYVDYGIIDSNGVQISNTSQSGSDITVKMMSMYESRLA